MKYPYLFYNETISHEPVFHDLRGEPFILDLSESSPVLEDIAPRDQVQLQAIIDSSMTPDFNWGVASYLENRRLLLSDCPQMVEEQRFYHLGLDVIVKVGTPLHAPLDAVVEDAGYEEGEGNYGAFILLRHESDSFETFYSLYGHLSQASLRSKGDVLKAGEPFAAIGDFHENGNWFHHTHIQVITKQGLQEGFMSKGYCSQSDLAIMDSLCPSPLPLFIK